MIRILKSANLISEGVFEEPEIFLTVYPNSKKKQAVLVLEINEKEVADCVFGYTPLHGYMPEDKKDFEKILFLIKRRMRLENNQLKAISQEIRETLKDSVPRNKGVSWEVTPDGDLDLLEY